MTGARGIDAAEQLAKRYPMVAVKLGSNGAALVVDGRLIHTSPPAVATDPAWPQPSNVFCQTSSPVFGSNAEK